MVAPGAATAENKHDHVFRIKQCFPSAIGTFKIEWHGYWKGLSKSFPKTTSILKMAPPLYFLNSHKHV
jgi:hypothetical protein